MASDDKAQATSLAWKFVAMLYDSKSREGRAAYDNLNKFRVRLANRTKSITRLSPCEDNFEQYNGQQTMCWVLSHIACQKLRSQYEHCWRKEIIPIPVMYEGPMVF